MVSRDAMFRGPCAASTQSAESFPETSRLTKPGEDGTKRYDNSLEKLEVNA